MRVLLWTGAKIRLPHSGTINLDRRNRCVLLHKAMGEDDRMLAQLDLWRTRSPAPTKGSALAGETARQSAPFGDPRLLERRAGSKSEHLESHGI
jgi:hypothetical protein